MKLLHESCLPKFYLNTDGNFCYKGDNSIEAICFDVQESYILDQLLLPYNDVILLTKYNSTFDERKSLDELRQFFAQLEQQDILHEYADAHQPEFINNDDINCLKDWINIHGCDNNEDINNEIDNHEINNTDSFVQEISSEQKNPIKNSNKQKFKNHWSLFNPQNLLDQFIKVFGFLRIFKHLVPIVFIFSVVGFIFNLERFQHDLATIKSNTDLLIHILFTLFTTSLATQLYRGVIARYYAIDTPSFGLMLVFGLLPRFNIRLQIPEETDKSVKLKIAFAPIFIRFILFPLGVLIWLIFSPQGTSLNLFGAGLAFVSMLSFLFVANPLMGSAGYRYLSEYYDEPNLRKNAFRSLRYLFFKPPEVIAKYTKDSIGLKVYAILSIIFLTILVGFISISLAKWLEVHYSGLGVSVFLIIIAYLIIKYGVPAKKKVSSSKASISDNDSSTNNASINALNHSSHLPQTNNRLRILLLILFIVIIFLPYQYESGGTAEVFPVSKQQIYVQAPGIVRNINYHGGEWVSKDALIAEMDNTKQLRDVEVTIEEIKKKQEELSLLLTTPSKHELDLAKHELAEARLKLKYSKKNYLRIKKLYEQKHLSYEALQQSLEDMEIDTLKVENKKINFRLIKNQVNQHLIESNKMEIQILERELKYYQEVYERTKLHMPFDGQIITMDLQEFKNRYFDEGDLFAEVEDISTIRVEVLIPESDISQVKIGNKVRMKLSLLPGDEIEAVVKEIHPSTIEAEFGNVVKINCYFDNSDRQIKSGMTGYVKIVGEEMFIIEAFTRALTRFIMIEAWSWLP